MWTPFLDFYFGPQLDPNLDPYVDPYLIPPLAPHFFVTSENTN